MPLNGVIDNIKEYAEESHKALVGFYSYLQSFDNTKNSIKNTSMGFVEGSATFVGNIPNIINNPKDYNIIYNSLKVNFLFLIPIFAYYNISRTFFALFTKDNSYEQNYSLPDFIFYTAYLKHILEYYFDNILLFTATAWLPLVQKDNKVLEHCRHKQSFDTKSLLIKPINILVEQAIIMFSQNHSLLKIMHYVLFSLYNGRALVKNKLNKENTCEIHQNDFLSKHTFYIAGLGASYIFITNYLYDSISEKTGFHNLFLYDAISSFVYQIFLTNSNYSKWNFKKDSFNIEFYKDIELITSTLFDKYGKKIESNLELFSIEVKNKIGKALLNQKIKKFLSLFLIPKSLNSLNNISHNQSLQLLCFYNFETINNALVSIKHAKEMLEKTGEYELSILSILLNISCPKMVAKLIFFLVEKGYITSENTEKTKNFLTLVINNYQNKEFDFVENHEIESDSDTAEEQDDNSSWVSFNKKKKL